MVNVENVMRVTYLGDVGFFFGSLCDMLDFQYELLSNRCILVVAYIY